MTPEDPKQPEELRQALVAGQVTTLGSMEITGAFAIAASVFGAPPEPNPTKPPRKTDDDAENVFHGAEDYR